MQRVVNSPALFSEALAYAQAALLNPDRFVENGQGRRFMRHCAADTDFAKNVFAAFGINAFENEPTFGNFLGNHFLDGAFVHGHKDTAPDGWQHVRCNFALQMPDTGGNPILDGKEVQIKQGDIWICFASLEAHSTTPMSGGQRLVFSCGAIVKSDIAEKVYKAIVRIPNN